MTWIYVLLGIATVLGVVGVVACGRRVSSWHSNESHYWNMVAMMVGADLKLDAKYRPILAWANAERPSVWKRMKTWENPQIRMKKASNLGKSAKNLGKSENGGV